ncbi:MAG: hypothetical protein K6U02_02665 [Firmicutes bacterium]|nr:hypothetical protein [Bacillota bacterium]
MPRLATLLVVFVGLVAPIRAQTIVVFPFENTGADSRLSWLEEGLAELTILRLAAAPGTAAAALVLTRDDWMMTVEQMGLPAAPLFAGYSRATMFRLAQHVRADFVIFGEFTAADGTLRIRAQALQIEPPALLAPQEISGRLDELMELHARLLADLLATMGGTATEDSAALPHRFPRFRLDAFESYVRGLLTADDEQRLRWLREAARLEPGWPDPAYALGQTYLARRDLVTALIWLSRVPPAHTRGFEAAFYSGVCHLLRDDLARAHTTFATLAAAAQARGRWPVPEVLNNLGVVLARQQNWTQAAQHFRQASQMAARETVYWYNLGLAELAALRFTEAATMFREVLLRNPEDAQARALLVHTLELDGQTEKARAEREAVEFELPQIDARPAALLRVQAELHSPRQSFLPPMLPGSSAPLGSARTQRAAPGTGVRP